MAAVSGAPRLSALLAWPTDHLTEAAAHWETVGERSYGVSHGVWRDALTVDWSGEAAEALRTDTHADMMTTSGVVDQLQEAASVARSGASELEAARAQVRYAVEDARSAGFEVGEDLSVTDRMSGGSAVERVARQAAAQAFAGNIGERAAQLVTVDAQVATRITAVVAGVGNTFPSDPADQWPSPRRRQPHVQTRSTTTVADGSEGHDSSGGASRMGRSKCRDKGVERPMRTREMLGRSRPRSTALHGLAGSSSGKASRDPSPTRATRDPSRRRGPALPTAPDPPFPPPTQINGLTERGNAWKAEMGTASTTIRCRTRSTILLSPRNLFQINTAGLGRWKKRDSVLTKTAK